MAAIARGPVQLMPREPFWAFALPVIALVALYFLIANLRKARLIEDTPTARVRSAPQGYVELIGVAGYLEESEVQAPLTGRSCCWYRFQVERKRGKDWRVEEKGSSNELFLLHDDTGDCVIDPEGAEVTTLESNVWYGTSRHPEERDPPDASSRTFFGFPVRFHIEQTSGFRWGGRYRYTEERLLAGDPLYAIGRFKTMDDVDHNMNRKDRLRELLREWKGDSSVMARFDRNQDGEIDPREWEAARRAAEYRVKREYQEELSGMVLNTLSKPPTRHAPYLLSSLPEYDLVRRYRALTVLSLILFFASSAGAAWLWFG